MIASTTIAAFPTIKSAMGATTVEITATKTQRNALAVRRRVNSPAWTVGGVYPSAGSATLRLIVWMRVTRTPIFAVCIT